MQSPVTVVGEALIDIVIPRSGSAMEHVGGSPANVAIGLPASATATTLATHIGTDARGLRIADLMATEGVTLSPGSTDAERTPTAAAHLGTMPVSPPTSSTWSGRSTRQTSPSPRAPTCTPARSRRPCAPGGAAVLDDVRAAREHATISYDPNARPTLMGSPEEARPVIEALIRLADVVKASDEDVAGCTAQPR